jgi:hypothetical protein
MAASNCRSGDRAFPSNSLVCLSSSLLGPPTVQHLTYFLDQPETWFASLIEP